MSNAAVARASRRAEQAGSEAAGARSRASTGADGGAEHAPAARDATPSPARRERPVPRRAPLSTLAVSHPGDPAEREAEAFGARVAHQRPPTAPAEPAARAPGAGPDRRAAGAVTPQGASERSSRAGRAAREAPAAEPGATDRSAAGSVAREGDGAGAAAQVAAGGDVPVSDATRALVANPGGGVPIPDAVRARIEPHLGADLSGVQVHAGAAAAAAAAELQARAFTVGAHVFLGDGQSVGDLELMGHEATHVVQQVALDTWRAPVARDLELTDLVPDVVLDVARDAVRALPGFELIGLVTGRDPFTDEPVAAADLEVVEKILTWGPFGAAVGPVLQSVEVLADVVAYLRERMAAHRLTWDRISADLERAWAEVGIGKDNTAIVGGYVDAFLADVRALVAEVADVVVEKVRTVAARVAEPLLQTPEIAPLWNLAVKVFRQNPLTGEAVEAPTVEILGDFLRFIGKGAVVDQMIERRTLQEAADWLDTMWGRFTALAGRAGALVAAAWQRISPANLPNLLGDLQVLADEASALVRDVGQFAWDVVAQVLVLVKKSLLGWLSEHAHEIPGFHLLTVVIERNPFTEEPVPRTGENLVRGFITLLPGGADMYAKLAESGAIAQAGGRIDGAVAELGISWDLIVSTFRGVWDTVTLEKLLTPIDTYHEIVATFGDPIRRIFAFISVVVQTVLELVLRMMNFPPELVGNVIANMQAAIDDIVADPVAFLLNLVGAMKAGFAGFFSNIGRYLLDGLVDWLFRGLSKIGVQKPSELSLEAAIKLVVDLSGVTMEVIWEKLAVHLGKETVDTIRGAVDKAGEAFAFIKEVQQGGFAAIWARLTEKLSSLWDTLFGMVKDWIMSEIVDKAVAKVLSMLDPTGIMAVINGAIAFFKAVQSVLDYIRELLEIVDSYVATIAAIAQGDVGPGAKRLEGGLAASVPVAIGFLANQVGLGDAPEKIAEFVVGLREKLFEALDWLIEKAVALGRGALAALTGAGGAEGEPAADEETGPIFDGRFDVGPEHHVISFEESSGALSVASEDEQPVAAIPPARAPAQVIVDLLRAYRQAPGTRGRRRQIRAAVDELKAILIANPGAWGQVAGEIGHAPNVGTVAAYRRKGEGWRPVGAGPSFVEVWELTAEHVIPDMFFTEYLEGLELPYTSKAEYRAMTTIMIYKGAADEKTRSDHTARAALGSAIDGVPKQSYTRLDGSTIERRSLLAVTRLMRDAANDAVGRTYAAVTAEEALASVSTPGKTRGQVRGGGPKPSEAEIASARQQQWAALQSAFRGDQEARRRQVEEDEDE